MPRRPTSSSQPTHRTRRTIRCNQLSGGHDLKWLEYHQIHKHILGPIWSRIPEKRRWDIVYFLNRSKRFCWSDLVHAALNWFEDDPCDRALPLPNGSGEHCRTKCGWFKGPDYEGVHLCECYCGKFQFRATEGASIEPQQLHTPPGYPFTNITNEGNPE